MRLSDLGTIRALQMLGEWKGEVRSLPSTFPESKNARRLRLVVEERDSVAVYTRFAVSGAARLRSCTHAEDLLQILVWNEYFSPGGVDS